MSDYYVVAVAVVVGILVACSVYFAFSAMDLMESYDEVALDSVKYWRERYENASGVDLGAIRYIIRDTLNRSTINISSANISVGYSGVIKSLLEDKSDLLSEVHGLREENMVLQDLVAGINVTGQCADAIKNLNLRIEKLNSKIAVRNSNISRLEENISVLLDHIDYLEDYKDRYDVARSNWSFYFEYLAPGDPSSYVTSDDPAVRDLLPDILGSDADGNLSWSDMRAIKGWVVENIRNPDFSLPSFGYNWSFWKTPAEVIESGYGDSSDCSRLVASLMLAEDEDADYIWCASLVFDSFSRTVVLANVELNRMVLYDPVNGWQSNALPEDEVFENYAGKMYERVSHVPIIYDDSSVHSFYDIIKFMQWF